MANTLPSKIAKQVRRVAYKRADEYGYGARTRVDSSAFFDALVEDPEVGGVLANHIPKGNIRTYIKDTLLNQYTKTRAKRILSAITATDTVKVVFGVETEIVQKEEGVTVCRSADNRFFVVSKGNILKWETALKKALELIARQPGLIVDTCTPGICLELADANASVTDGDKKHLTTALDLISVKARIYSG